MKKSLPFFPGLVFGLWLVVVVTADASGGHVWRVASPDHEQTFADGSEQSRTWAQRGADKHLVVLLNFTNDPFVDRSNPRQYDSFSFSFPSVTLGTDARTFYFHAADGHLIPVASKERDFFGVNEIHLLPDVSLLVKQPHGYLSLMLVMGTRGDSP
jgi:hypothetical protein